MRRGALLVAGGLVFAVAGLLAPAAGATLRAEPLESSCDSGFTYGEITAGPWRVEGCHRPGADKPFESLRERFRGDVELNGMVVEGSNELIVTSATDNPGAEKQAGKRITDGPPFTEHRVQRNGATLVLDPVIAGNRRRIPIYTGRIDFSKSIRGNVPADADYDLDIPVGSGRKLLGMRMQDDIENATLVRGGGGTPGSIAMRVPLSLGSGASSLLSDWITRPRVELRDGQGMLISDLEFNINRIPIPGVGEFEGFRVEYHGGADEWSGDTGLDLGELFPAIDFDVTVNATTGVPTDISTAVSDLDIPIGNTGIVLQEITGSFQQNPLVFGAGAVATAGPQFGSYSLLEIDGDVEIRLEPNFRLEIDGGVRVFPTSPSAEIATGSAGIILDSDGYIAVSANAHVELLVAGIGASATANGSGAYSTTRNRFNIQAGVTGTLHAGFLGDFNVAQLRAVVSSEGWGTCGTLAAFIKAGVGQEWGSSPDVFLSCDLGRYRAVVSKARMTKGPTPSTHTFEVEPGTERVGIHIIGDGPEPDATVVGPGGTPSVATLPTGVREIGETASVISRPGESEQLVVLNEPEPGTWEVEWDENDPDVTQIEVATDAPPIRADVSVETKAEPGMRQLRLRQLRGLAQNERVTIGIKTPQGIVPIGDSAGGGFDENFAEVKPGKRKIVAMVTTNGIPNPERSRTLGTYRAELPVRPGRLIAIRVKDEAVLQARVAPGAEPPDEWQYLLASNKGPFAAAKGAPGKVVRVPIPDGTGEVLVAARPVVDGKPLTGQARLARLR